jgi:hypothetical protein
MSNEAISEVSTPATPANPAAADLSSLIEQTVSQALAQFQERQKAQSDPPETVLHSELAQERKKRETLERRVNELIEEGRRAREAAEQAERYASIKSELQQLGVTKVDLAFKAVRDDVRRDGDKLVAQTDDGLVPLHDYLAQWVTANPEFKPARIAGGAGTSPSRASAAGASSFDLERIRPGMSAEEMERARQEIARVAAHAMGGQIL